MIALRIKLNTSFPTFSRSVGAIIGAHFGIGAGDVIIIIGAGVLEIMGILVSAPALHIISIGVVHEEGHGTVDIKRRAAL